MSVVAVFVLLVLVVLGVVLVIMEVVQATTSSEFKKASAGAPKPPTGSPNQQSTVKTRQQSKIKQLFTMIPVRIRGRSRCYHLQCLHFSRSFVASLENIRISYPPEQVYNIENKNNGSAHKFA